MKNIRRRGKSCAMKTTSTFRYSLLKIFSMIMCMALPLALSAQQQHISGKGTSNFSNVKKARTAKKLPPYLSQAKKNVDIFKKNIPFKGKGNDFFKKNGSSPLNPMDASDIYIAFSTSLDCSGFSSYATNNGILFIAGINTAYPLDSNNITVTIDFGDGTSTTVNPSFYFDYTYFDSTLFAVLMLHTYSSAGNYTPSCTVITAMGDTATQTYYQPITISSGSSASPSITSFSAYSDQYCGSDSMYYYGYYGNYWGDSLYYYGTYLSINVSYPALQSLSDIFTVYVNYGDGSDTTFQYSFNNQYQYWWWWNGSYCPPDFYIDYSVHNYSQAGAYNISCTVTFPDGSVDIASAITYIADHCVTVGGKVFIDNNANCVADSNEAGLPWVALYIPFDYDSAYYYDPCYSNYNYNYNYAYTDSLGNYRFSFPDLCPMINDTIKFDPAYNFYPVANLSLNCPASGYHIFNTSNPQLNYDFALGYTPGYDLQGSLWGWRFRPGFQGYIYPFYGNYLCDTISGIAKLVIDNPGFLTIDSVQPPASAIVGDTIMWNFNEISLFDWGQQALVYISTDTSAHDGDTIHTTLILEPMAGDADPSNNIISQDFMVSNSWDPNEKEVFPKGKEAEGYINSDQMLSYVVHFQNTGSDTAYNIYLTDTIDIDFDLNSLKVLSSSHYMEYSISGNIVTFSFPNIMLPDSSKGIVASEGFVSYQIKPYPNLPEATTLINTAYIYFDFNPAVITNTTLNTITYLTGASENSKPKSEIRVYPNPAKTELFVRFSEVPVNANIVLYDMLGRKVYHNTVSSSAFVKMNISNLSEGLYFLEVQNAGNTTIHKVVVDR